MNTEKINIGEIYGKQTTSKFSMYHVLKVSKNIITLQNIDNPLSLFETTSQKLESAGYVRVSQTPYINTQFSSAKTNTSKKRAANLKPSRCPYTTDLFENRADNQRPLPPTVPDLFTALA